MRVPVSSPVTALSANTGWVTKWFTIARGESGVQKLVLPAHLIPVSATCQSLSVVSNAATTATVTITGNATTLATFDVKTNKTSIAAVDSQPLLALDRNDASITATYAETGTASTLGGPWLVAVQCLATGST